MPKLPLELMQLIIDYAVEAFRVTKDGSALVKLMHVSCLIRSRLCHVFSPVRVYERDVTPEKCQVEVHLPRSLAAYCGDALEWAISDFSSRRYSQPPSLPDILDTIVTTTGLTCKAGRVEIELKSDALRDGNQESEVQRIKWGKKWGAADQHSTLQLCRLMQRALLQRDSQGISESPGGHEKGVEQAAPRVLSIFKRALRGRLDASSRGVVVDVKRYMWFVSKDNPEERSKYYMKRWLFDTVQLRPPAE